MENVVKLPAVKCFLLFYLRKQIQYLLSFKDQVTNFFFGDSIFQQVSKMKVIINNGRLKILELDPFFIAQFFRYFIQVCGKDEQAVGALKEPPDHGQGTIPGVFHISAFKHFIDQYQPVFTVADLKDGIFDALYFTVKITFSLKILSCTWMLLKMP